MADSHETVVAVVKANELAPQSSRFNRSSATSSVSGQGVVFSRFGGAILTALNCPDDRCDCDVSEI